MTSIYEIHMPMKISHTPGQVFIKRITIHSFVHLVSCEQDIHKTISELHLFYIIGHQCIQVYLCNYNFTMVFKVFTAQFLKEIAIRC